MGIGFSVKSYLLTKQYCAIFLLIVIWVAGIDIHI